MSDIAIKVENLTKTYKLYDAPSDRLKETLHPLRKKYHRDFNALKDICFEIKKGETVGIIGKNGSGKSTLLKIITGVLTATSGKLEVSGRISALLELGAGFNPEYTGIENVYLNGTMMGYSREEMDKKVPAILEFADIGDFVYQPVKTYSSGMFVRLAFAVAINVDPDILIVDEALAVGDDLFQKKCYAKIDSFKKAGKTILFVSHSGSLVIELCDKAIMLDDGEKIIMGNSNKVVNLYQKLIFAPREKRDMVKKQIYEIAKTDKGIENIIQTEIEVEKTNIPFINNEITPEEYFDPELIPKDPIIYENKSAEIFDYKISNYKDENVNVLRFGKKYTLSYKVKFLNNCQNVRFGMLVKTKTGIDLSGAHTSMPGFGIPSVKKGDIYNIEFEFNAKLAAGVYFLRCGVVGVETDMEVFLDRQIDAMAFRVLEKPNNLMNSLVDIDINSNVYKLS